MDQRAREFYRRYGKVMLGRARVLLGDDAAAKEALQEILSGILGSESHILDQPSPTPWLYRLTTNVCLNRLRDDRRRERRLTRLDQAWADRPSAGGHDLEARAIMLQILDSVPREMQEIAVYRLVDEMTHAEIADLTGISVRVVDSRLVAIPPPTAGGVRRGQPP